MLHWQNSNRYNVFHTVGDIKCKSFFSNGTFLRGHTLSKNAAGSAERGKKGSEHASISTYCLKVVERGGEGIHVRASQTTPCAPPTIYRMRNVFSLDCDFSCYNVTYFISKGRFVMLDLNSLVFFYT